MNAQDEYTDLRAAAKRGARIQAWHLKPGALSSAQGHWVTLLSTPEPAFSCPAHLYRVHPSDVAEVPA